MSEQITVIRGEDRTLILRMVFKESREPYDLAGWDGITVEFKRNNRSTLVKTSELNDGDSSIYIHEGVTFTADIAGLAGNDIELIFDGVDTIDEVVDAWNFANGTNTVSYEGADGSEVFDAVTLDFAGGKAPYRDVNVINETLGKIEVRLNDADTIELKSGPNQSFKVTIDKNSAHPSSTRRIVLFDSKLNVVDPDIR